MPELAPGPEAWQRLVFGLEAEWLELHRRGELQLAFGLEGDPLAARQVHSSVLGQGSGWLEELPRRFVDTCRSRGPAERQDFLRSSRRHLGTLPFDEIHPSWIAQELPEDLLTRSWALQTMPQRAVERLLLAAPEQVARGGLVQAAGRVPPWFASWWRNRLRDALEYPHALPELPGGEFGLLQTTLADLRSLDAGAPASGIEIVLVEVGLQAFAAAVYSLPREEVPSRVMSLPASMQRAVVARVRDRVFLPGEGHPDLLDQLPENEHLPLALGLVTVKCALLDGQPREHVSAPRLEELRRVELSLPRKTVLQTKGVQVMPCEPSQAFVQRLEMIRDHVVASGLASKAPGGKR